MSITVAYNGQPFSGFAKQPGQLTVQGEIEHALRLIFRREVETVCAGRTDAGVHALGQIVSFAVEGHEREDRNKHSFLRSMNALTNDAISIREVERRGENFSARFDAKFREYRYFICNQTCPPMFMHDFSWHISEALDIEAMEAASRHLIGEHDFKSFCLAVSAVDKPTCRNVMEISFDRGKIMGDEIVTIKVVGNAFLHSMVRTIVGTLVMVGRRKRSTDWTRDVLLACDRAAAGENAPAKGLVFWRVGY